MKKSKTIYALKLLIFLLFFGQNFEAIAQTNRKIDPSVFQTKKEGKIPFFVVMKSQADVSAAYNLETKEEKGEFVFSTLRNNAKASQADIQYFLKSKNIDFQSFWIINALFMEGDALLINLLAARTDVAKIVANPTSRLQLPPTSASDFLPKNVETRSAEKLTWGLKKIKADSVWQKNIRGQGVVIGGQDTGYDWAHPALKKSYRGFLNLKDFKDSANHNYNWHDAIHRDSTAPPNPCGYDLVTPCDDNSHGTHTMGTMSGSVTTNDSTAIGVAPDALWIGARNMNRGNGTLRSYVECFEWFLAPTNLAGKMPNPRLAPHVINNSWYCSIEEGCNASNFAVLEAAVNACRAAGIVVVVSVGNSGSACSTATGPPGFSQNRFRSVQPPKRIQLQVLAVADPSVLTAVFA
ncbi:MAG: S8 family serine peptidase [Saprospiraceae bacterium]|nr:S8 family serine peptidase [Saprospiraceae bacterium]